ncbi:fumarylacetoacetate hydrolase family protein [Pseudofrankia inefficax]|uniref:Fumarylacetoacetate (FAA) hydrolase n=1 Tax=Pseudofrankia inefficax (strain DSM 45817 / CECT 9037 / DDB 130130 / EuI1c) TaxID=298654 RepID=E3IUJ4_PSEI1|nr:fumarylacetoacetate hydrolase family protein [Pseudofrankia inefficax]ADP83679.1 fumarylacetoacetate (FAA) hydrolase [Pseudofrankia inefficax]
MRIVNTGGRLGLVLDDGVVDVATASGGRFGPGVQAVYEQWARFRAWAAEVDPRVASRPLDETTLGAPAPQPRQVFAIGLNYLDHAEESAMETPSDGMVVFTKFPSSVAGPVSEIEVPPGSVDFEAELVVVIGARAYQVAAENAWDYVAGLTVGQDVSERELQLRPPTPQFNLGKSFPGFAPIGPQLVTPDAFENPDDVEISCSLNGVEMQRARTKIMIFPVAQIISRLSAVLPLLPGDVIFTGTPSGIGWARDPKVLLKPGDELVTTIENIGSMRNRFVPQAAA